MDSTGTAPDIADGVPTIYVTVILVECNHAIVARHFLEIIVMRLRIDSVSVRVCRNPSQWGRRRIWTPGLTALGIGADGSLSRRGCRLLGNNSQNLLLAVIWPRRHCDDFFEVLNLTSPELAAGNAAGAVNQRVASPGRRESLWTLY